jgi:hypothetical protein
MDALLPTAERYASQKFRRVAQYFRFKHLDWWDALELVAFVESIGLDHARYILHWKAPATIRAYLFLRDHVGDEASEPIRRNVECMGLDQGLGILAAMKDGGWTKGKVPDVVRMSLLELRKRGMKQSDIAKLTGLSHGQVNRLTNAAGRRNRSVQAAAFGALAL